MNINHNTPRLTPPKVIFEGKEALLKPMVRKRTTWITSSTIAASIILIVGLILFWPIEQISLEHSPAQKKVLSLTTTSPIQPTERLTPQVSETKSQVKGSKPTIKGNGSKSPIQKKQTKPKPSTTEIVNQALTDPQITKHKPQALFAIIQPTLINVGATTQTPNLNIQATAKSTKLNINKFRSITIFSEIKQSIIEQVLSTPVKMGLLAQDKIDPYLQDEKQQENYIL